MTFMDRIRGKILNKWIVKKDKNGNLILVYITSFPVANTDNRIFYPGYYCRIEKGKQFNYMNIKELYDPSVEGTFGEMRIWDFGEILDYSTLKDAEIKKKLAKHFAKKLLTV